MKFKSHYWLGMALCAVLALSSCEKDDVEDPVIPNEEEVITTVRVSLVPSGGGTEILMSFVDMDADGPDDPVISVSDTLMVNTAYSATVLLLNETETPSDTVNAEIIEEAEEHQFFFGVQSSLDLTVTYNDSDADGNPIGLMNTVQCNGESQGTFTVTLRHEPDKTGTGVANGDITNAGGETDIEAEFDVFIR